MKEELRSDSLEEDISIPMVVVWGCNMLTYLLHVLLLYDQSWCQFGWGGGRGMQKPCRHYCLLGNAPKSKHCSKNCALENSLRINPVEGFVLFHSLTALYSVLGSVFFKEFLFLAKVAIIHTKRKMQKKWRSSLGRFCQIWLQTN
jgi:hypothetical protein